MEIFKIIILVLLGIELFVWLISITGTKEKLIPIILTLVAIATITYIVLS